MREYLYKEFKKKLLTIKFPLPISLKEKLFTMKIILHSSIIQSYLHFFVHSFITLAIVHYSVRLKINDNLSKRKPQNKYNLFDTI